MYFNKEYVFKGKHAQYVMELKDVLFERNIDVLLIAPILGMAYNRKSYVDNTLQETTKVFSDQMTGNQEKILFNFRLCVLTSIEFSEEEKKDLAFKYYAGDDEDHLELFQRGIEVYQSYVLGGVEILYENMLQGNRSYNGKPDDIKYMNDMIKKVIEFVDNYKEITSRIDDIASELMSF